MIKLIGIMIGLLLLWYLLKAIIPYLIVICIFVAIGYGVYRIIFKKNTILEQTTEKTAPPESVTEKEKSYLALTCILANYAKFLEHENASISPNDENNNVLTLSDTNTAAELSFPLNVDPKIKELLWIADGKNKNYTRPPETRFRSGIVVKVICEPEEPSAIYLSLPVSKPPSGKLIERPPYYPTYKELSPEQRWMYWEFLANPFSPKHNIGYVFLFYYGLERHMISGNLDKAFEIILKLREVHSDGSFQSYTADMLIKFCLEKQRTDLVSALLESYNSSDLAYIPINHLLILKYKYHYPLTASEIIKNYQYFGFSNNRYIKNQPELFKESLSELIQQNFQADSIDLNRHFSMGMFEFPMKQERIFANPSLRDYEVTAPSFHNPRLTNKILTLLKNSHEDVKARLRYGKNINRKGIKHALEIDGHRFEEGPFTSADGHAFEAYCANLLSSDGFTSIEVTQDSQDQGVDIIAQKDGIKYGVQCKLYSKALGNSAIQEIYAGIALYGCQKGIVLTNNYFTESARILADATGVILWDKEHLLELQKQHSKTK